MGRKNEEKRKQLRNKRVRVLGAEKNRRCLAEGERVRVELRISEAEKEN